MTDFEHRKFNTILLPHKVHPRVGFCVVQGQVRWRNDKCRNSYRSCPVAHFHSVLEFSQLCTPLLQHGPLEEKLAGDSVMCQGMGEKCVQPAALMIMEVLSLCGSDAAKIELIKRK